MRISGFFFVLTVLVLVSGTASAGNLRFTGGVSQWQSTRCPKPVAPPNLLAMDSETPAGSLNSLLECYNAYAVAMQRYMDCVSTEAKDDSDAATQTITQSAEATISNAQNKVKSMHDALAKRE